MISENNLFGEGNPWNALVKMGDIPPGTYEDSFPFDEGDLQWLDSGRTVLLADIIAAFDRVTKEIVYVIDGRRTLSTVAGIENPSVLVRIVGVPYSGPEDKVRRVILNNKDRIDICGIVFDLVRQFGHAAVATMLSTSERSVGDMTDKYIREVGTAHAFSGR